VPQGGAALAVVALLVGQSKDCDEKLMRVTIRAHGFVQPGGRKYIFKSASTE